jgi:UDP-N-acetylmuramate dehydrogenase
MSGAAWTEGVTLAPLTSWRIGGPCRAFAEPKTPAQLTAVRFEAERRGWPVFLLGGGTNLLIADSGYPGLVIRYVGRARRLEASGSTATIRAGAGMALTQLARQTARAGWAGVAWAEGIPGTVAGAVVGNAGAYGGEIAGTLESVELIQPDGTREEWSVDRMDYAYRSSALKGADPAGPAIVAAHFRLERLDPAQLAAEIERIAGERKARTPAGPSAGSVFRNPPNRSAGRLIDEAGCKGMRCGRAAVSLLHANYIINEGGATAREVLDLINTVRSRVRDAFGLSLELEIQLVGFSGGA